MRGLIAPMSCVVLCCAVLCCAVVCIKCCCIVLCSTASFFKRSALCSRHILPICCTDMMLVLLFFLGMVLRKIRGK